MKWTWLCRMIPDSCVLNDYGIHTEVIRKIERCISLLFCLVFVFIFIRFFACLSVFFFFFNEMSLSSLYEAFRCTIFCHFFLMWKVQFLNIKKIYICIVFFNYISYMAISKGQIIKSRQWSEIMSPVRNEEKTTALLVQLIQCLNIAYLFVAHCTSLTLLALLLIWSLL